MAFLKELEKQELKSLITTDLSTLGKLYKAKKNGYQLLSVDHSLAEDYIKQGWELNGKPLKTKTKLRKEKSHDKKFEDDIWCQFYELGFRALNFDNNFVLPFSKSDEDTKQIDVIAINDDSIFLIECKSSKAWGPARLLKEEFELLGLRIDGFKKALWEVFGRDKKIKFVFATRNLRIPNDSIHLQRLDKTNSLYYNNNTYDYINSLIKNYKNAALYQFMGLVFKNELINNNKTEIPALKGKMGKKDYYMFSIEPSALLKMGFILHRTRANESEFPTYQRLLVPSRLKGITKFINTGGYFPNSIILNFSSKKHKLQYQAHSKLPGSKSTSGVLKIPNAYGIAYIIDGQHRVYGYAGSDFKMSNTIPVVAFTNLETVEQLEIFMDINENQKAVSPSLRLDLAEDLNWDSDRADSRMLALKSSITKKLGSTESSPLFNKISVGEDKSYLTFKPFMSALTNSGLLPTVRGNKYDEKSMVGSLYNCNNHNHSSEMIRARKKIVDFIIACYSLVEDSYPEIFNHEKSFIVSNRGTYAFISLIGSLNIFESEQLNLNRDTKNEDRVQRIQKYLVSLLDGIEKLSDEERIKQLTLLGSGADTKWLRFFQSIVNKQHPKYNPTELIDWKERQDENLQEQGRKYGVEIEKRMKSLVLQKLKELFGSNWELEINPIKRECLKRAEEEKERHYKEFQNSKDVHWTEMFNINDYKAIIEKYWTNKPKQESNYVTFEGQFSIDLGLSSFNSKKDKTKWIALFNSYRNLWAHEGTKEKRLNKEEVSQLHSIHQHFNLG